VATHATAVLDAETSAREAVTAWDSANLHIKGAEDRAALVEREELHRLSQVEAKNFTVLSSAPTDTEDLVWKVIMLKDELVVEHRARETSEREHRVHFEELTLLQNQGSELGHAIIDPPWARHLSNGMRLAALRHTKLAGELAAFRAVVSSATESVLGCSPSNTTRVEVVAELAAKFQKLEGHHSKLEPPANKICDLLLVPLPDQAWLANGLDEATGQLREELAARQEATTKLEFLWSSAAWVQDLVLGDVDGHLHW
jgi:hypothetical protein